jgi:hypothetical protein
MSYLLFGAIDEVKDDLVRLSNALSALQRLNFDDTHPAIVVIRERIVKLQAELKGLEENI